MKYIDAEKLIAEIKKRQAKLLKTVSHLPIHRMDELESLLSFIDSLRQEQSEVDLEKDDIIDYVHSHFYYDKDFDGYGHSKLRPVFTRDDIEVIARHFYELGLNARKEDTK